jgi:hypothetical protein
MDVGENSAYDIYLTVCRNSSSTKPWLWFLPSKTIRPRPIPKNPVCKISLHVTQERKKLASPFLFVGEGGLRYRTIYKPAELLPAVSFLPAYFQKLVFSILKVVPYVFVMTAINADVLVLLTVGHLVAIRDLPVLTRTCS